MKRSTKFWLSLLGIFILFLFIKIPCVMLEIGFSILSVYIIMCCISLFEYKNMFEDETVKRKYNFIYRINQFFDGKEK